MNTTKRHASAVYQIPTRETVDNLKVGDLVINCMGRLAEVTEITARGLDIHGKAYVCFYQKFGENSTMSHSFKEGKLVRTVQLSGLHLAAELDQIEREMLAATKV